MGYRFVDGETEAIRLFDDCDVSGTTKHLYRIEDDLTETTVREE